MQVALGEVGQLAGGAERWRGLLLNQAGTTIRRIGKIALLIRDRIDVQTPACFSSGTGMSHDSFQALKRKEGSV